MCWQWEAKEWPLYREVRAANTSPWPCPLGSRGRAHNGAGEGAADRISFGLTTYIPIPIPITVLTGLGGKVRSEGAKLNLEEMQ